MVRVALPIYLPSWAYGALRTVKRRARTVTTISLDLYGDREVEWSYIASRLPDGPGRLLDFGASFGNLSIVAAQRNYEVLALDLGPERFPWKHGNVNFLQADLLEADLPAESFDVILNCSSVEHVGLSGRYGVAEAETDGDLAAMEKFYELLKPTGAMLMTIPCGQDAVIAPWHRVYGHRRLPRLLEGFAPAEECYWVKHEDNRWYPSDRGTALAFEPTSHPNEASRCSYALGCFVLRKEIRY
jgi:SAM-dependent methyltransferase